MYGIIDDNGRGHAASSQTSDYFKREQAVFGGFTRFDVQLSLDSFEKIAGALDVTSCAVADFDRVLSGGTKVEMVVECGYTHDLCRRQPSLSGHLGDAFGG